MSPAPIAWRRGLAWLAFLGPFFYLSYGIANHLAATRGDVPSVVFDWEHAVPFVAWSIVPYWSINAFYAASLFVHRSVAAVDVQGRRLLTAQLVAVACFLLWPLHFSVERPDTDGLPGAMFDALTSFDKPYNQAPSLHIALLVILWTVYTPKLRPALRPLLHAWFLLIGISVLTTYQHHFIDIPTGALLGAFCLWLWPEHGPSPLASAGWTGDPARRRMALRYALGSVACAAVAAAIGGTAWWLLWPAVSLLLVALAYAVLGTSVFQKQADGRLPPGARLLLLPYLIAARVNQWAWTRALPADAMVADDVRLGRVPRWGESLPSSTALLDLSAELHTPATNSESLPCLDLVPPDPERLKHAAERIEALRHGQTVRVACALGFSRSACAVATWLLRSGRAPGLDEAIERLRAAQPRLVIGEAQRAAILKASA